MDSDKKELIEFIVKIMIDNPQFKEIVFETHPQGKIRIWQRPPPQPNKK